MNATPVWRNEHDSAFDVEECIWPTCEEPRRDIGDAPLCMNHLITIGAEFARECHRQFLEISEPPMQGPSTEYQARMAERDRIMREQSQVYYVRIGDHIKIGCTINVRTRMSCLRVDLDQLLATEPGSFELERQRHLQFADERVSRREDFNPSLRLLAHIEDIKAEHGPPNITWYPRSA